MGGAEALSWALAAIAVAASIAALNVAALNRFMCFLQIKFWEANCLSIIYTAMNDRVPIAKMLLCRKDGNL